jgi:UPF0755 protein
MSSYLAFDIGEKRIGVAVCDAATPFPAPLTTLHATPQLANEVAQLLKKHNVIGVVIGHPRNQHGETTAQTERVKHIASLLKIPNSIPVYFQDESLTSVKAEKELERRKKPYQKADIDALAATFILEDFIAQQRTQPKSPASTNAVAERTTNTTKKPRHKKAKHTKKKRPFLWAVCFLFTAMLTLFGGAFLWYQQNLRPLTNKEHYQVITIPAGNTTANIADTLHEKSIIRNKTAFTVYARLHQDASMQAGSYRLSSHQSVSELVAVMASGDVSTVNVLIAPGQRVDQIVNQIKEYGYEEDDILAALDAVRDHPLLKNIAAGVPLEGYIFPETYQVAPDTTAEQLLRTALNTFQERLESEAAIAQGIAAQGLSFKDAVIIASIVQKEVPDYETQQKVAQVFIKRYKEGMPLGADPTFKYAAAMTGQAALPNIDSPYNTRKYAGLPPTAIANFNITALRAVANPAPTNYTYFVAGDDGITRFSNTLEEHERLTAEHCIKLCQ